MKRITKEPKTRSYIPATRLYMEDIEYIHELMKRRNVEVTFSDGEYNYDSIEDLQNSKREKIRYLKIEGIKQFEHGENWINLSLEQDKFSIFTTSTENEFILLVHEIDEYLRKKIRWHQRILNPWIYFWMLPGYVILLPFFARHLKINRYYAYYAIVIVVILFPFLISLLWSWSYPSIYISRTFQIKSFWQRNRDKIILMILGAFIGGFIKWLFDLFLIRNGKQ